MRIYAKKLNRMLRYINTIKVGEHFPDCEAQHYHTYNHQVLSWHVARCISGSL